MKIDEKIDKLDLEIYELCEQFGIQMDKWKEDPIRTRNDPTTISMVELQEKIIKLKNQKDKLVKKRKFKTNFLKKFGLENFYGNTYRFSWGEIYWKGWNPKKWNLSLTYRGDDGWDEDTDLKGRVTIEPLICSIYINAPSISEYNAVEDETPRYGFYIYEWEDINLEWGLKRWYWRFPFVTFDWEKTETIDPRNRKVIYIEDENNRKLKDWEELSKIKKDISVTLPYQYNLRNGEVQNVNASVFISRMTWKRKWLSWFKKVRTSIDISFDEEVGEERGSWKGGCIGCGWELFPDETVEECLKRMEKERRFER